MDYNATKGGVDNLDKLVSAYSCKRRTLRWPLVIFFDILDGIEPRVEQREAPVETPFSWGTWKDTGETTNPKKTACSENLSLCSHREEDSAEQCCCPIHPTYRTTICRAWCKCVWCCCSICLTLISCETEVLVKIHDLFIILGCGRQQQKETPRSVLTQGGQKDAIYMHQVQEVHMQHTHTVQLCHSCVE